MEGFNSRYLARLLVFGLVAALVAVALETRNTSSVTRTPRRGASEVVASIDLEATLWSLAYDAEAAKHGTSRGYLLGRYMPLELVPSEGVQVGVWSEARNDLQATPTAYADSLEPTQTQPTFAWLDEDTLWVSSGSSGVWYALWADYFVVHFEGDVGRVAVAGGFQVTDDFSGTWYGPRAGRIDAFLDREQVQIRYALRYPDSWRDSESTLVLALAEPTEQPPLVYDELGVAVLDALEAVRATD